MLFVIALVPLLVGAVYYNPKVAGTVWMKSNGFTEEDLLGANMGLIFFLAYLFSCMLALFYSSMVIHQSSFVSLMIPEVLEAGSAIQKDVIDFMAKYGDRHRTFSHGAAHGVFTTIFFATPLIAINALFERKGWKYVLVHFGYWLITLVLMGGFLCATLEYAPIGS